MSERREARAGSSSGTSAFYKAGRSTKVASAIKSSAKAGTKSAAKPGGKSAAGAGSGVKGKSAKPLSYAGAVSAKPSAKSVPAKSASAKSVGKISAKTATKSATAAVSTKKRKTDKNTETAESEMIDFVGSSKQIASSAGQAREVDDDKDMLEDSIVNDNMEMDEL